MRDSSFKTLVDGAISPRPTPLAEIPTIVEALNGTFRSNKTKSLSWRRDQLSKLYDFVTKQEELLQEALWKDLRKDPATAKSELMTIASEAAYALDRLNTWAKPVAAKRTLFTIIDNNKILMSPKGVVCIISTWNYPFLLLLGPLVAAIAAGNCVLLKPSEVATHTEALLLDWIPKVLDNDAIKIISGSVKEATCLLEQKFDHIFFTGNESVGKVVMAAAAKHLCPVTLELGGKSPVYIDKDANVSVTAHRLIWGKFYNNGQTCIAPDYVLAHKCVLPQLLPALKKALEEMYTINTRDSVEYARIINHSHATRLITVLERQRALLHSEIVTGGDYDRDDKFIAPFIVCNVRPTDPLMEDEIFGPLLGIIPVEDEDEALQIITSRPHPLSMFIFSNNKRLIQKMIDNSQSGSVLVNDFLVNMIINDVPFGGVGASGMGAYHGKHGFLTFSHQRTMVWRGTDPFTEFFHGFVYPPFANHPFALSFVNYFTTHRRPSNFKVFFDKYVPVKLVLLVAGIALVFEIGRRVGVGL
ncbi:fatty aldehyde dehydrogenase [Obelidium mucronatum]|nr:fatty aldehyde dehydrogenase [Obelidium mucronatum]